jgi:DNA primase
MIKQQTIDAILDLSVLDVIEKEQELTKRGATHQGVCPFHDDNGPSLMVSKAKNIDE